MILNDNKINYYYCCHLKINIYERFYSVFIVSNYVFKGKYDIDINYDGI